MQPGKPHFFQNIIVFTVASPWIYIIKRLSPMKKVILAEDIKAVLEKDRSFFNRSGIHAIAAASNEEILALHRAEKLTSLSRTSTCRG
jgi:hypothetical protein